MSDNNYFEVLNGINVNEKVEKKDKLNYLSWTWAWAEVKKRYNNAKYEVVKNEKGLPYFYDENVGYMVFTWVEVEGIRHDMWLPVMDGKNKTMLNQSYTYNTKYGDKTVDKCTMFDINKTIMRCLTKNLAMHGLGLYIYSGEDLPEEEKNEKENNKWANIKVKSDLAKEVIKILFERYNRDYEKALNFLKVFKIDTFEELDTNKNKIEQLLLLLNIEKSGYTK